MAKLCEGAINERRTALGRSKTVVIAWFCLGMIALHLLLRHAFGVPPPASNVPLLATYAAALPLLWDLLEKVFRREFGSDLLAGISILTSAVLGEYLAGAIVVLMLSGGDALEEFAKAHASSVLRALARRMPAMGHLKLDGQVKEVSLDRIEIGHQLVVFPHEICPVDGIVLAGHSTMDESFLTGEPFQMAKTPGTTVLSGSVNGESALTISATKRPDDSRYAKIMEVMRASEKNRPRLRRLGDQLGAIYTPVALILAVLAWMVTGDADRFLAVLVVATPCPLLIGIPVAIIGAISLAARRGIIVKNPVVLEQIDQCESIIFDKTGTLTYGEPKLTEQRVAPGFEDGEVLALTAGLERYSKHPLAGAILAAARSEGDGLIEAEEIHEVPGQGLRGVVRGHKVQIISRSQARGAPGFEHAPPAGGGLECFVLIDSHYAACYRFRDAPRSEGVSFVRHLAPKHHFAGVMLLSGDRESEVRYLAEQVGIKHIYAQKSPEEKLEIVRAETARRKTAYVGDGINDAPAMMAATVGIAIGQNSDITAEAADVVVMEGALKRVDEFIHISHRMRRIALESAVGGMALSVAGMCLAAMGVLTPVAGAITQEVIDVLAVLNALRAALRPKAMSDFE